MADIAWPFVVATTVFLACVGGCDRTRLSFLEDDSREYRKRILALEIEVMTLKMEVRKCK